MNDYEIKVYDEVADWKYKILKRSGMIHRLSKKVQGKVNSFIPEPAHRLATGSIKAMVKAVLIGSKYTTKDHLGKGLTLKDRDELVRQKISSYQKAAILEGAGTGAGGILLGLADFPLFLTIKIKFLFDAAAIYGFDTTEYEERLFILYVFQLAFSSSETRKNTLFVIENWEEHRLNVTDLDWREFQQEYRDYIDLSKILQLVPGIGAAVGAFANNNLVKHLGETAMNAYRLRILKKVPEL